MASIPAAAPAASQPTVNGEKIHSQTLDHFTSYPLIHDILGIYTANSLGKKSIELYNRAYGAFFEPVEPYLRRPYSYARPTLQRLDSFGNSSLDSVDSHFPAVTKTNIDNLREYASETAHLPLRVAAEGRDYFFGIYNEEYKKAGGEGIVFRGKALVSTELRIVADILRQIGDRIGPKSDELSAKLDQLKKRGYEAAEQLRDGAEKTQKQAGDKVEQTKQQASSKAEQTKQQAASKAEQTKKQAASKADEAKAQANGN